ncbi:MAG TPA: hypothetical protein VK985_05200 [Rariglobus sp.]|nr:hypothetical protein [Rariglobus sp.]
MSFSQARAFHARLIEPSKEASQTPFPSKWYLRKTTAPSLLVNRVFTFVYDVHEYPGSFRPRQ